MELWLHPSDILNLRLHLTIIPYFYFLSVCTSLIACCISCSTCLLLTTSSPPTTLSGLSLTTLETTSRMFRSSGLSCLIQTWSCRSIRWKHSKKASEESIRSSVIGKVSKILFGYGRFARYWKQVRPFKAHFSGSVILLVDSLFIDDRKNVSCLSQWHEMPTTRCPCFTST